MNFATVLEFLIIIAVIGYFVYINVKAVTEVMTVMDIDQAGVSTKAGGVSVGLTKHISVGGGKSRKAGSAMVTLKNESGVIDEYKIPAKYLMKSEIRQGDKCTIKHYKKKVLNFEIDRTARFK